jgi:hypothetical protein
MSAGAMSMLVSVETKWTTISAGSVRRLITNVSAVLELTQLKPVPFKGVDVDPVAPVIVKVRVAVVAWAGVMVMVLDDDDTSTENGRAPVTVADPVERIVMSAGAVSIVGSDETNEIVISPEVAAARLTTKVSAD